MSRTIQIGASFAIVLVAYSAYALLVVPLIETQIKIAKDTDRTDDGGQSPSLPPDEGLKDLFRPDAWELHDAKTISSNDRVFLLWKTYATKPDNWVELNPLTIVFMRDENAEDPVERIRHAIVMEVPAGANLRFDRPLDLKHGGGLGRLIEGQLRGQVTIRSRGKRPDHQDDLLARTHDVALTEQRITTPNQVEFSYGPSWGRGQQLEIKLLPRLGVHSANQEGPDVGGIKQLQIEHVERMHLVMGQDEKSAGSGAAGRPAYSPGGTSAPSGPVEITCRGPFCFDLVDDQVATFRDQVVVLRERPNGTSDRMTCDMLSVFFTRPPHAADGGKHQSSAPGFDLQPSRIEARGSPTVLTAPTEHLQAWAEVLRYNLADQQVFLEDGKQVLLRRDRDEIHAPSIRYTPGPPEHTNMFQLLAAGPGWLRGEMADRPGQQLEARWGSKLEVRPQQQNQVISLTGAAELKSQAMGQLDADEIHFWLHEAPPDVVGGPPDHSASARTGSFQPDRLLALGEVAGDSTQFSIKRADRLEVWFTTAPRLPPGLVYRAEAGNSLAGSLPPTNFSPSAPSASPHVAAAPAAGVVPALPFAAQSPAAAGERHAHLEITGRVIQARVLLHDRQQGELTGGTVTDGVRVVETQTAQIGDLPVLVTGDWLNATEANSPQAKVTVLGKPAHMEGRGLSLTGPSIAIDRGANRLTMDCPGQMEKFLDRDLENRPLSRPGTLRVNWEKGMTFDGRKAHFDRGVNVRNDTQLMKTSWLDVYLQHPISFSEARPQDPALVEKIICGEGVSIVNQAFENGQQTGFDRIQLKDLDMNNITGDFHASGPGRVISVRRGGNQAFNMPGGPLAGGGGTNVRPAAFAPAQPPDDPNQLSCLDLTFMKSITGNKNRKDLTFHGQVRAAHAPAQSWATTLEDIDPKRLGKDAVILHSESLEVADMSPVSGGSGGNTEFQARDNVKAEGNNFYALCARLSYSQAKDQMIFEGDGRSDAELYKQEQEGVPVQPFKAQKIIYFTKTKQVNVDGFHSAEMNQAPEKSAPPPPARRPQ
jgi:lipopolysaccharide export system protein LptA